jgi:glycosyltransferase involved in cell wall biosynthesis
MNDQSHPAKVLIVSSDILPLPGLPTTGAGLRAWGIGQGLATRGHTVVYSMPAIALEGRQIVDETIREYAWTGRSLSRIIQLAEPDVVIACNWPVAANIFNCPVPLVLDQHGPHLLERQYQAAFRGFEENARFKRLALSNADYFSCAGDLQRLYFLPWLMQAGFQFDDGRVCSIPISLSPELPPHEFSDELTFVYGGVFLPWQDPRAGLQEVLQQLQQRDQGRLKFFGGKHPVYPVDTGLFEELRTQLDRHPRVQVQPMVAHDELIEAYRHAHVAIDLMARNPERELAFTTRTVEYLWCGLPVIYSDYAELSHYIREYHAGWTINPDDGAALRAAVSEVFEQPDRVREYSRNAQRLVRERLTWDRTIEPLDAICRNPSRRERVKASAALPEAQSAFLLGKAWGVLRRKGPGAVLRETRAYLRWRRELRRIQR